MIRISSGEKKGKKLKTLDGNDTRPTSERLKLSVFNILQNDIEDKIVLDLFSGSGQMSLEAISRGALFAVMCDSSKQAADIIKKNIELCEYQNKTKLVNKDYIPAIDMSLNYISQYNSKFNLVFLDPPYSKNLIDSTLFEMDKKNILENEAVIIAETDVNDVIREDYENYHIYDTRKYGRTKFVFYKYEKKVK